MCGPSCSETGDQSVETREQHAWCLKEGPAEQARGHCHWRRWKASAILVSVEGAAVDGGEGAMNLCQVPSGCSLRS